MKKKCLLALHYVMLGLLCLCLKSFTVPSLPYTGDGFYEEPVAVVSTGSFNQLGVGAYTSDGTYYEDNIRDKESGIWGNSSFWEDEYMYEYFLDSEGLWWRHGARGWQKWINAFGWHWSEIFYRDKPSIPHQPMFEEDPTAPIDLKTYDFIIIFSVMFLTAAVKNIRQKKQCAL